MWRVFLFGGVLFGCCGCGSSKWAMDDKDYEAKYSEAYPDDPLEKSHRMAKQIVDARHVAGKGGWYGGAAFADDPTSVGVEVGGFGYPTSWLSTRMGLSFLGGTGAEDFFTGGVLGTRVQFPSRLSPFVGAGVYGGFSQKTVELECGCEETEVDQLFAALYPEVGMHFWTNGHWRATANAAYYFNTEGRDQDFWFFGISLGRLNDTKEPDLDELPNSFTH